MNRIVIQRVLCVLGLTAGVLSGCASPTKYDSAKHGTAEAAQSQAGNFWKKEGWWSLKAAHRKVVISEFSVEYVTQNATDVDRGQLGLVTTPLEIVGVGKRKRQFEDSFKRELPTALYDGFVQQLQAEGFTVVPMASVTAHARFGEISGAKEGKTFSANERNVLGGADRENTRKIAVYPVKGLPIVDDSWFKGMGNLQAETAIASELGADLTMRVRMRVALDDDGRVVLDQGSTLRVLSEFNASKGTDGKPQYWAKTSGAVACHHAMRDSVPVVTSEDFKAFEGTVYTIDSAKYRESLLKMYPNFARMAVVKLKS